MPRTNTARSFPLFLLSLTLSQFSTAATSTPDQNLLASRAPAALNNSDGAKVNYELGLTFSATAAGQVKAIRFYKAPLEKGAAHTGKIYNSAGKLLASVVFQSETASGWQQQNLAKALDVAAGTTYVVSVNTGNSYYADTVGGFSAAVTSGNLKAPKGAGVFGPLGSKPSGSWNGSNYFRDIVFTAGATSTPAPVPPVAVPSPTPVPVTPTSALSHGKDLTLAMVGPAAIGITAFTKGNGAGVYDASSASYIRKVSASATYDGFAVSGPHLLIQGMDIAGSFDIYSTLPVVIRGSRIRGGGYWSVFARPGAAPVYVLYCDLGGSSIGNASDEAITTGNAGGNVFARNHISIIGDAFSIGSQNDRILENYAENFDSSGGAHNDGLQAPGDNNGMLIARNKILVNTGETGAINLGTWGGGVAQYVTIDSNYFAGGGWTFYGGGSPGQKTNHIVSTNNIFGYDFFPNIGSYGAGPAYWDTTGQGNVWSNNKDSKGTLINAE